MAAHLRAKYTGDLSSALSNATLKGAEATTTTASAGNKRKFTPDMSSAVSLLHLKVFDESQKVQEKGGSFEPQLAVIRAAVEQHNIVLFSVTFCEYCWAVKNILRALDLPHQVVEIDTAAFCSQFPLQQSKDDITGKAKLALASITSMKTIPQASPSKRTCSPPCMIYSPGKRKVFINHAFIGGATAFFDLYRRKQLHKMLKESMGVDIIDIDIEAYVPAKNT